jgi:hypothetical protein
MVEYDAGPAKQVLTRRIVSFRKLGSTYRRAEEIHRLRLFEPADLMTALSSAGFRAKQVDRFGRFRLPAGIHGFIARKARDTTSRSTGC